MILAPLLSYSSSSSSPSDPLLALGLFDELPLDEDLLGFELLPLGGSGGVPLPLGLVGPLQLGGSGGVPLPLGLVGGVPLPLPLGVALPLGLVGGVPLPLGVPLEPEVLISDSSYFSNL